MCDIFACYDNDCRNSSDMSRQRGNVHVALSMLVCSQGKTECDWCIGHQCLLGAVVSALTVLKLTAVCV
eukprot:14132-Heterococcus_DN1.PRE.6